MKILVPIKRVPASEQRIAVAAGGRGIDEAGVSFTVNPFDAIAAEEALRIRERAGRPVEIVAVSIGAAECEEQLRTALAMGVDRALLVAAPGGLDPWCVARLLAAIVASERPHLVLMGKQAVDDDSNQVGQFLAALIGWPQATFASRIELDDATEPTNVSVTRETDSGSDLRLNEPRYASLPAIIKSRKQPIEHTSLEALGVPLERRVEIVGLESSASQRTCVRVDNVAELVRRLREEAKVV
jgi:electron transfer flavoprotein beta subunit